MFVVVPDVGGGSDAVGSYAATLSRLGGVTAVESPNGTYVDGAATTPPSSSMTQGETTYLAIHTSTDPQSGTAKSLLSRVEATPAPWPTLVGGETAVNRDSLQALKDALPYALAWIAIALFTVLFLFTGSVVLPLKALGLRREDEVVTTAFTFFATAGTIHNAGGTPVFVDIDPVTYNISPGAIEAAITRGFRNSFFLSALFALLALVPILVFRRRSVA